MLRLVETVKRVMERRRPRVHVPVSVMKLVAPVLAALSRRPPITPDQLLMLSEPNVAEPNHAKDLLDELVPFEEGIRAYLAPRP